MVVAAVVVVFVLLVLLFVFALCSVASRADDQSDALYDSLTQAEPPADPEPARRAGLRIVKG